MSDLRHLINGVDKQVYDRLCLTKGVGIGIGMNRVFAEVIKGGGPFFIEEPRFIYIREGTFRVNANLVDLELRAGTAAYVRGGSIVQMSKDTLLGDFHGVGVMVNDEVLNLALHGRVPQSFNGQCLQFVHEINDEEGQTIVKMGDLLWTLLHQEGGSREPIYNMVAVIVNYYDHLYKKYGELHVTTCSREMETFRRFIVLINQHSAMAHQLDFYADKMCMSAKYLGTLVKHASGMTVKEWIDRALVVAAKVMLRHSDATIFTVADQLNFPNVSFFCKYFKRFTGMTPMQYRRQGSPKVLP